MDRPHAIRQLKDMGLMPANVPEDVFHYPKQEVTPSDRELKKMGMELPEGVDITAAGKPIDKWGQAPICVGCNNEKSKLKSGKYVKTNVNIQIQEQWPHMSVLRKYSKRVGFEKLEFDAFVAGETRTILAMKDRHAAQGRLDFLSKIAHWLCRSKDWGLVRGLYEAVLESIELGEE